LKRWFAVILVSILVCTMSSQVFATGAKSSQGGKSSYGSKSLHGPKSSHGPKSQYGFNAPWGKKDAKCERKANGSKQHPYVICDAADLQLLHDFPSAHFVLERNIDLQSAAWTSVPSFSGTLDGRNHILSNLSASFGLFEQIAAQGVVKNVQLHQVNIHGAMVNAGGLAGTSYGRIDHVYVSGSVTGVYDAGGIVDNNYGVIASSRAFVSINATFSAGGIASYNASTGVIERSESNSQVSSAYNSGGIVGSNSGLLKETKSYGTVALVVSGGGGLVGSNDETGIIRDSKSYADVYYSPGEWTMAGKLVGNDNGQVIRSYGYGQLIPQT
jgi:hypothetical protein